MTFVEILIDAIYEYVDRYIILDDTYLDETEESYESDESYISDLSSDEDTYISSEEDTYISSDKDTDISSEEDTYISSDEDMTCTYTILT